MKIVTSLIFKIWYFFYSFLVPSCFQELELKAEFEQVNAEAESLRAELEKKQTELEELGKQKEEMDLALANSPLKQQASELMAKREFFLCVFFLTQ